MNNNNEPETLQEAIKFFSDPDNCLRYVVVRRWPDGVACPTCGSREVIFLAKQRRWQCKGRHKQFSVKVGTVMEDSPIGLDKWLCAFWMLANCKNGISSYEVASDIGVTQKTAWFMMHRIRLAVHAGGSTEKMSGEVEADETFIGGKARNMHLGKRIEKIHGRGPHGKAVVLGLLSRHDEKVRAYVIPTRKKPDIQARVRENVEEGAALYTDALKSYEGLAEYAHQVVDHAERYVDGNVHTNKMENFWSLLKRSIKGTYVSVEPFHLFRYLDEQVYRYNNRKLTPAERFSEAVAGILGKRVTYKELTGNLPEGLCQGSGEEKGGNRNDEAFPN